jgi:hypothetical protein
LTLDRQVGYSLPMPADPASARPERPRARQWQALLGFSLGGMLLLLTQLGYRFEALDQLQYLLLPYRQLDPGFLPGDWFTWRTTHYHHSYAVIVRALALLGGPFFAQAMFVAQLGVLAWLSYAVARLSRSAGLGWAGAVGALLLVSLIRETGIAGATTNHGQLIPADLALPPLLLACAAWLEDRPRALGAWLGLSGLLHANFALLGPLLFAPLLLRATPRSRWVATARSVALPFLPIVAPSLVLIVAGFFAKDAAPEAIDILFHVRSPHHYDVRAMPAEDLWWPVLICIACLPALWRLHSSGEALARRLLALLAALAAVTSVSLIGSLLDSASLIRLFTFRLSVPLLLLLAMTLGADIREAVLRRDAGRAFYHLCAVAALSCFARDDLAQISNGPFGPRSFALPVALALWVAALPFVLERLPLLKLCGVGALGWAVLVARVPLDHEALNDGSGRAERRGPRLSSIAVQPEVKALHGLVRSSTPADARFLIPPSLIDFRLGARRAVYVDWKCAPMRGDELLQWKRRMLAVMGTPDFPFTGYELRKGSQRLYEARSGSVLLALARSKRLTHAVLPRRHKNLEKVGGDLIGKAGHWAVFRVLSSSEWKARKLEMQRAGG